MLYSLPDDEDGSFVEVISFEWHHGSIIKGDKKCSHQALWFIPDWMRPMGQTRGQHVDRKCLRCGAEQCGTKMVRLERWRYK